MQTETRAAQGFTAGVKDYRLTYYMKDYQVHIDDLLAAFRVIAQPGVPPEEAGAAIAAESSTGTWTTVWTDGLTSLDRYKGRCYDIELVSGEDNQYIAYVAYPLDLFEEGSVTNILTSIVGNVFGFKLAIFGAASWPCRLHGIMLRRGECDGCRCSDCELQAGDLRRSELAPPAARNYAPAK